MDAPLRRRATRGGLLTGVVMLYLCLVGLVTTLDERRLVNDLITLGELILLLPAFIGSMVVVRERVQDGQRVSIHPRPAAAAGALAGAIAGVMVALAVLLVIALPEDMVRNVFVSVTQPLLDIVTFGLGTVPGLAVLIGVSTVLSALGALLAVADARIRRPVTTGLIATLLMAMLQNVFRAAIAQLGFQTQWLYSARFGGLTIIGALVVFAIATAIHAGIMGRRRRIEARPRSSAATREDERQKKLILTGVLAAVLVALPILLGSFLSSVLGRVGIFLLMGLGLNIVVGYAGLLDLGYVAFFAVGAYGTGVLTAAASSGSVFHPGLPFFVALPIVVAIAVFTGILIGGPVLRLRGDYLAIVTLGFGEIARILVQSDWLRPLLGGAQGLFAIPAPVITAFGVTINFRNPQPFYYLALSFCLFAVFISYRLEGSRIGRAWMAMREDEQVAEATGVSTVKYKLLAFGCGAAIGSLAGALFAVQIGSLAPTSFTILISIQVLAIIILGGMGSIPGVVVGALVLVGLPGFLSEFESYQLLIYGAALMAMMLLRPQGLVPNVRRSRELQEEERLQDQWAKGLIEGSETASVSGGDGA